GLSDEGVCERWVYDPYFQHFTGEEFFQHEFPHERSDLSHWRKRLGGKLGLLLAESLRVAHESGALRTKDLARVTGDTTVQPKDIPFPTDAKLLHATLTCRSDPLAAAAPARLEAVFLPRSGGGVHRQGQGQRALRIRCESFRRHHQCPGTGWPPISFTWLSDPSRHLVRFRALSMRTRCGTLDQRGSGLP